MFSPCAIVYPDVRPVVQMSALSRANINSPAGRASPFPGQHGLAKSITHMHLWRHQMTGTGRQLSSIFHVKRGLISKIFIHQIMVA